MTNIADYTRQPDSVTCQSAAIAKVLGQTDPASVQRVRRDLLQLGVAGDPLVMGRYLEPRVKEYQWAPNGTLAQLRDWVTQGTGYEAIVHGMTTGSGHIWGVTDYEPSDRLGGFFNCDDPWACFSFPEHRYLNKSGNNVPYSALAMYSYCVVAWTEQQAINAYRAGAIDWAKQGMYLHLIRN